MNDTSNNSSGGNPQNEWLQPGEKNIQLNYILLLVGFLGGITAIVGGVLAFLNKDKATSVQQSHYVFQFRTFLGMLVLFVGAWIVFWVLFQLLALIKIAFLTQLFSYVLSLVWLAALVWYVVRCVKGLQAISKNEAIADPNTLLF